MSKDYKCLANPLGNKPKKSYPNGGWTKPDNAVRCKRCGVGKDEAGGMVGTPIASYIVSAQLPEPDERGFGSVAVARVPMCYKCRTILPFTLLDAGLKYGISGQNVIKCLKQSRGTHFTLEELLTGRIEQVTFKDAAAAVAPVIENEQAVDTENTEEEQATSLF